MKIKFQQIFTFIFFFPPIATAFFSTPRPVIIRPSKAREREGGGGVLEGTGFRSNICVLPLPLFGLVNKLVKCVWSTGVGRGSVQERGEEGASWPG